ncbi:hypothetical protein JNW90_01480 [Micromonospora sp. STR1s_5]|nr:hypothetical protein [Micromonospora sp. STR1s_5]
MTDGNLATAQLAERLATLEGRLARFERTGQLARSSVEGGALIVSDAEGRPVLAIGDQGDGTYGLVGLNGGRVLATDLNLPAGTITETDISDDAISTPKLTANAITADKIDAGAVTADKLTANAIDGRIITGATLAGGEVITAAANGSYVHITNTVEDGAVIEVNPPNLPDPVAHPVTPGSIKTGIVTDGDFTGVSENTVRTAYVGPSVNGKAPAEIFMTGNPFGSNFHIRSDYFLLHAKDGVSWVVDGDWEIAVPVVQPDGSVQYQIHFQVWNNGRVIASALEVAGETEVRNGPLKIGLFADADTLTLENYRNTRLRGPVVTDSSLSVGGALTVGGVEQGAWQVYTPVWSALTTAPTLNNGALTGRWSRVGKTVTATGQLFMGSTTTYGAGAWTISLPVPAAFGSIGAGAAVVYDSASGSASRHGGACWLQSTTTLIFFGPTGGAVSSAVPFAWNAGDQLRWTFTYEAA